MADGLITVLQKCLVCGGAFYPSGNPGRYDDYACTSCLDEFMDIHGANYEAARRGVDPAMICYAPEY